MNMLLSLEPNRPNMREVRAPQDAVGTDQGDHLRTIGVIDQPVVDPCPHVVAGFHLERAQMHARAETVRVLQTVQVTHEMWDPRQITLTTDSIQIREAV